MAEARVFGIVLGDADAPRVAYLKRGAGVDAESLRALGAIEPTRVFRHAARCEGSGCAQFAHGRCALARRIVEALVPVTDAAPPCQIRDTCRWHAEEGTAACLRCPQVVTLVPPGETALAEVALPVATRRADGAAAAQNGTPS